MDLESLSVDELKALKKERTAPADASTGVDLESLSVDELLALKKDRAASLEEPGFLEKAGKSALEGVIKAGQFVDSYTGAPTRSAIGAIQSGKNPLSAFVSQFGEDPSQAPSGHDIVSRAGVSDAPLTKFNMFGREFQPSAADLAGFAVDVGADPTNLLPLAAGAKMVGKGGRALSPLATAAKEATVKGIRAVPGGNVAIAGAKAVGETAGAVKQALNYVFKSEQAPDFSKMAQIAAKHGIDPGDLPESIEFGDTSFISRASRNLREGPLGQPDLERFERGYLAVQDATNNTIAKIGGGPPMSDIQAGTLIRQGYDDAVDRLFKDVDFTYNQVIDSSPGISLTSKSVQNINEKLGNLQKFAESRVAEGITNTDREQGKQLLNAISAVRRRMSAQDPQAGTFGSLKQVYGVMSDIGRHAFQKGKNAFADVPVDQKKFQELYFTLRDEFINTTDELLGRDITQSLVDSNQLITNFNENKSVIASLVGNKNLSPEQLYNALILRGDSKRIGALKEILSYEQLQQLKGSVLENLIKRDPDGSFNFTTLFSAMRTKRNLLESLFTPQEIVEFGELVKLGHRFGPAVLSSSGTGASNLFGNLAKGIGDSAVTRSVVTGLKDSARGRAQSQLLLSSPPQSAVQTPLLPQGSKFARPTRGRPEELAKYLQILGATGTSNDKKEQSAVERRLQELVRARLGQ